MDNPVLEKLLKEISPESPCGENLEYEAAYIELGRKIQGTPEDPFTKVPAQPPNWKEIRQNALAILQRSRDLRIILYLIRALIHLEGFAGLQDGLAVLEHAIRDYWPSVYPQLDPEDDNDPTLRVNIVMELADFETVLWPVALIPLVESRAIGRFALRDLQVAAEKLPPPAGTTKPDPAKIQAAFREALENDAEALLTAYRAVGASLSSLEAIETFVTEQVGVGNAPNLADLRTMLKEIRTAFEQHGVKDEVPEEDEAESGEPGAPRKARAAAAALETIAGREDVIRALTLICEYYARCEPSSPVPLLLLRAKRLVTMNFMDILKELAPSGVPQVEVIRGPDIPQ